MNNLKNKIGRIVFSKDSIMTDNPTLLKSIFSNLYPIVIVPEDFYNRLVYYGYSEHFREVIEGEIEPEYQLVFKTEDGAVIFDKMIEVTK